MHWYTHTAYSVMRPTLYEDATIVCVGAQNKKAHGLHHIHQTTNTVQAIPDHRALDKLLVAHLKVADIFH